MNRSNLFHNEKYTLKVELICPVLKGNPTIIDIIEPVEKRALVQIARSLQVRINSSGNMARNAPTYIGIKVPIPAIAMFIRFRNSCRTTRLHYTL